MGRGDEIAVRSEAGREVQSACRRLFMASAQAEEDVVRGKQGLHVSHKVRASCQAVKSHSAAEKLLNSMC